MRWSSRAKIARWKTQTNKNISNLELLLSIKFSYKLLCPTAHFVQVFNASGILVNSDNKIRQSKEYSSQEFSWQHFIHSKHTGSVLYKLRFCADLTWQCFSKEDSHTCKMLYKSKIAAQVFTLVLPLAVCRWDSAGRELSENSLCLPQSKNFAEFCPKWQFVSKTKGAFLLQFWNLEALTHDKINPTQRGSTLCLVGLSCVGILYLARPSVREATLSSLAWPKYSFLKTEVHAGVAIGCAILNFVFRRKIWSSSDSGSYVFRSFAYVILHLSWFV